MLPRESKLRGGSRKIPARQIPTRGVREVKGVEGEGAEEHAARHMGGDDAITPFGIGASPIGHGHPPRHNYEAVAAPGVTDDSSQSYAVGSHWYDTTNDKAYACLDATEGAAVWIETTQAAGGGAPHAVLGATHNDTLAGVVAEGDVIIGNATPKWARLPGNTTTTRKLLSQTGDGAASAAPAWAPIGITDDDIVEIDHAAVADDDYAKFTANGLEGRSYAEVLSDIAAASTALSNLAAVAINTTIKSDADNTDDLGATTKRWKDIYFAGDLKDDTTSLSVADLKGPKRTAILSAQSGKGTTTSGCDGPTQAETGATAKNYWYLSFAANEKAFWQGVMPYNWDGDTVAMTAKFHWLGASGHSASDTVIWGIKAVDIGNNEVMTGVFGTQRTVTDTVITADRLHISDATASSIFPASPDAGELVIWEVERTGGTMTEEALLLAVHITYTTNAYEDWT
jgi:hypothetical protein